mgnify:CR=1 FL=1
MRKILISIGTNTQAPYNMYRAKSILQSYFPTIQFTIDIENKPFGQNYKQWFLNTLGYFKSDLSKNEIISRCKHIEKTMGRLVEHKSEGKVIIDIDLIQWGDEIIKPNDFKRSYIIDLLPFVKE